ATQRLVRQIELGASRLEVRPCSSEFCALELRKGLPALHGVAGCSPERQHPRDDGSTDLRVGVLVDADLAKKTRNLAPLSRLGPRRRHTKIAHHLGFDSDDTRFRFLCGGSLLRLRRLG